MGTKTVAVDYGATQLEISVPESAHVIEQPKPRSVADPEAEVRAALANPIGMPPIKDWVKPNSTVTIAFDDPTRPALPRQVAIPVIVEQLLEAGVRIEDITLISSGSVHRKYTQHELRNYLGPDIYDRFQTDPAGKRVICHDASDPDGLVDLGRSSLDDHMEYNRCLIDSDHIIYCGTVMPNHWGGANGNGVVIGLAGARSCRATHRHGVIDHPESHHCDPRTSHFNLHKRAMMTRIEEAIGKKVFYVNAFPSDGKGVAKFTAGHATELNDVEWTFMEEHYQVDCPQADILIAGIPLQRAYSDTHNPLTFVSSLLVIPRWWVGKPMMRDGGALIGVGVCKGIYEEPVYTAWAELLKIWDRCKETDDLSSYEEDFLNRDDLLHLYHHHYCYHPIHPFWLFYQCQYAFDRLSKVLVAGDINPREVRRLNVTPTRHFDDAMRQARQAVGDDPTIVVMPSFWGGIVAQFRVS